LKFSWLAVIIFMAEIRIKMILLGQVNLIIVMKKEILIDSFFIRL